MNYPLHRALFTEQAVGIQIPTCNDGQYYNFGRQKCVDILPGATTATPNAGSVEETSLAQKATIGLAGVVLVLLLISMYAYFKNNNK